MILIQVAMFVSDIYTAVVLLAFDRWSTSIKPFVPFRISRWLFGGCIILSVVLWIYDFIMAWRTMRTRNISLNYTTPIARNCYSIRDYSYFCLFAKITKSKSKREYVALFVYFTFKGWIRFVFAESPRQVLNGLTIYSVFRVDNDFVGTVKKLADNSLTEAVVLSFMAFSCLVWVISLVQFLAALFVVCPLMAYITPKYSGIEEYCCVRVNKRISELVKKHHKKELLELAKQNKSMKQPELPSMNVSDDEDDATIKPVTRTATAGSGKTFASQPSKALQQSMTDSRNPFAERMQQRNALMRTVTAKSSQQDLARVDTAESLGSLTSVNSQVSLLDHSGQRRPSEPHYMPGGMLGTQMRRPTDPGMGSQRSLNTPLNMPNDAKGGVPYPMKDPFLDRNDSISSRNPFGGSEMRNITPRNPYAPHGPQVTPQVTPQRSMSSNAPYPRGSVMAKDAASNNPFTDMPSASAYALGPQLEAGGIERQKTPPIPVKSARRPSAASSHPPPPGLARPPPPIQRQRMPSVSDSINGADFEPKPLPRVRTAPESAGPPRRVEPPIRRQATVAEAPHSNQYRSPQYRSPPAPVTAPVIAPVTAPVNRPPPNQSPMHFEGFDGVHAAGVNQQRNDNLRVSPAAQMITPTSTGIQSSARSLAGVPPTLPSFDTDAESDRASPPPVSRPGPTLPSVSLDDDDDDYGRLQAPVTKPTLPKVSLDEEDEARPVAAKKPTLPKISLDDDDDRY